MHFSEFRFGKITAFMDQKGKVFQYGNRNIHFVFELISKRNVCVRIGSHQQDWLVCLQTFLNMDLYQAVINDTTLYKTVLNFQKMRFFQHSTKISFSKIIRRVADFLICYIIKIVCRVPYGEK